VAAGYYNISACSTKRCSLAAPRLRQHSALVAEARNRMRHPANADKNTCLAHIDEKKKHCRSKGYVSNVGVAKLMNVDDNRHRGPNMERCQCMMDMSHHQSSLDCSRSPQFLIKASIAHSFSLKRDKSIIYGIIEVVIDRLHAAAVSCSSFVEPRSCHAYSILRTQNKAFQSFTRLIENTCLSS